MTRILERLGDANYAGEDNFILQVAEGERVSGEVALWRAVITQALMDAGSQSNKREMRYDRAQAIAWLSGASEDFQEVCARAHLDPGYVRDRAKTAIRRGCAWRKEMQGFIMRKRHKAPEKPVVAAVRPEAVLARLAL